MSEKQTEQVTVEIEAGEIPLRRTEGSAGYDLTSVAESVAINPSTRKQIDLGLKIGIPPHHCGLVVSRSGLDVHHRIFVPRVRVIDSDYRGKVTVDLENGGSKPCWIKSGDRIAQLLIVPVPPVTWKRVEKLGDTCRGEKGFGSTGK